MENRNKLCFVSIDVEHDYGGEDEFRGVENLYKILSVFKKNEIPATLFVTGVVLEKYKDLVKSWSKDYEIACHSFSHRFWNSLSPEERKKELEDFIKIYQQVLGGRPRGFRAPSHLIDSKALSLLEEEGFLYDSSVVPHYPFFKKYRGYQGKAPLFPYNPSTNNYRIAGNMKILEIPVRGPLGGVPLAGAWLARLPFWFYQLLIEISPPAFLTINMHSWDVLQYKGRKSKVEDFLKNLDNAIDFLKTKKYKFLKGEEIFNERAKIFQN